MKKVECISCGGTGVIRRRWCKPNEAHLCYRCNGFGFVLMAPTEFAKFQKVGNNKYLISGNMRTGNWFRTSLDVYKEFTGLVKVRNIRYVFTKHGTIPYSVFYREHRNPHNYV